MTRGSHELRSGDAMRVLYVANRHDAPFRYRCVHAGLQLRRDGAACDVMQVDDPRLDEWLARYSVIVLFRLPWSSRVARLIDRARSHGATVVFDMDDLVFEPNLIDRVPFLQHLPSWERLQYEHTATRLKQTLHACDAFLGATPALARAAERLGVRAFVHPNLLHPGLVRTAGRIMRWRWRLQQRPILSYLSGSMTHNEDLATISPVLADVMALRSDVRLLIAGFIEMDRCLRRFADRVIRLPFLDWRVQPWAAALARVNLAPLQVVNDFTNAKSALKFFESAIVAVPTVATPTEPFRATIQHGVNGFLASTPDEWRQAIDACLDRAVSRRIGCAARQTALAEHTHDGHRGRLREILASLDRRRSAASSSQPASADGGPIRPQPLTPREPRIDAVRRLRAALGVLRRASHPERLSRPELWRLQPARFGEVDVDSASPAESGQPAGGNGDGVVEAAFDASAWRRGPSVQPVASAARQGWLASGDRDPWLIGPEIVLDPAGASRLRVTLTATSDYNQAVAQLFWHTRREPDFMESSSLRFPVICDGREHTYVVDLSRTDWPRGGQPVRRLRLDPLDAPGEFRLREIKFLRDIKGRPDPMAGAQAARVSARGVDIVVPIYNARHDVERCVESVLRHACGDWRLVLVNDASTDPELVAFLERTAASRPRVVLLHNEKNAGFVLTANRGMRHAAGRDVLLLNSDTIVTADFLQKLGAGAYADRMHAIVCPLTNNGTVCSAPEWLRDNPLPADMSVDEYAEFISKISFRRHPDLVTGVGFCMYIRADVIERIGVFDEEAFGRGFGEENDFCERAKEAGYLIRLCDDLFVAHMGKASFGDEGRDLERVNGPKMDQLHPRYLADVAEFCRHKPFADILNNIKYHVRRRSAKRHKAMMFVVHASPFGVQRGGTEYHVHDLVKHLALPRAVVVYPQGEELIAAEVLDGRVADACFHGFDAGGPCQRYWRRDASAENAFEDLVDCFDVGAAHIHHVLNLPIGLWRTFERRSIPYVYSIHDYYAVCPSLNLMHHGIGQSCECPSDPAGAGASGCLAAQFSALGLRPPPDRSALLAEHRAEFGELLRHAAAVVAPSRAAYEQVRRRYPDLARPVHIIGHGYDPPALHVAERGGANGAASRPLRVGVVGQSAYPSKGAKAYLELVASTRNDPVEWHFFGDVGLLDFPTELHHRAGPGRLHLHGPYSRENVCRLLGRHDIDVALFLPVAHETFCFTLSEAWMAGVPAIVADAGALPERVAQSGAGVVVRDTSEALALLKQLAHDRTLLNAWRGAAAAFRHCTLRENADLHRAAYGDLWGLVTAAGETPTFGERDRRLFRALRDSVDPIAPVAPPAAMLPYQRTRWYGSYRIIRGVVPLRMRAMARSFLLRHVYHGDDSAQRGGLAQAAKSEV